MALKGYSVILHKINVKIISKELGIRNLLKSKRLISGPIMRTVLHRELTDLIRDCIV